LSYPVKPVRRSIRRSIRQSAGSRPTPVQTRILVSCLLVPLPPQTPVASTGRHSLRPITFLAAVGGLVLAGCSSGASSTPTSAPTTTIPPTTTTTEQPGWTPVSTVKGAIAVDSQAVTEPSGTVVSLYRFRVGKVTFGLHVGTTDPLRGTAVVPADSTSTIGPNEMPLLVSAFNGGFETNTGTGGFELNGQTLVPLRVGYASLVIDTDGSARIGVWGQTVPTPGESVASVRQNLAPLVAKDVASPQIASISAWGATLGGGSAVARSALGQDSSGNLIYAGSMSALPSDMANALISAGTVTGMELDINPAWVQLAYAGAPGAPLTAGIPGTHRPANQYQQGWTRDFVTVLAAR